MTSQEVILTVPAQPEFLRVARMTASGLASRVGFNIDEVDDLRLAMDELCFAVIGKGAADENLRLSYQVADQSLEIQGTVQRAPGREPLALGEFSRQILTALVDEHRLWEDDGASRFELAKRRASTES